MKLLDLEKVLKDQPGYRLKQVKKALFHDLVEDWDQATTLPLDLRKVLSKKCPIGIDAKLFKSRSSGTIKALITLSDGEKIETVLMKHEDNRNTVCVSSQVGCKLGCKFCATGQMGLKRDLKWDEIVEQVLLFARILKEENQRVTNVVFMGMGEPLLNYENVMKAIEYINDKDGLNIGARKISVSTAGVVPGILKLAGEPYQVNLAISLHAPSDKLRSELMPINKKYPIKKLLQAVDEYIDVTNRKVMFEYILLRDVNDDLKYARELSCLLRGKLCVVNLIPCNKVLEFFPPDKDEIKEFKEVLEKGGINVVQRYSFGQDIDAACGQLAVKSKK